MCLAKLLSPYCVTITEFSCIIVQLLFELNQYTDMCVLTTLIGCYDSSNKTNNCSHYLRISQQGPQPCFFIFEQYNHNIIIEIIDIFNKDSTEDSTTVQCNDSRDFMFYASNNTDHIAR